MAALKYKTPTGKTCDGCLMRTNTPFCNYFNCHLTSDETHIYRTVACVRKDACKYKEGQRVLISGEVYYGGTWYRVSSGGSIESVNNKSCLVNIDSIDGDEHAVCTVQKKYIYMEDN